MNTTSIGRKAEELAGKFMVKKGYRLAAKNMRNPGGEIDLILSRGDLIVFLEVKLRKKETFARALEHVDARKRARYIKAAEIWLADNKPDAQARFDVIEVYGDMDNPGNISINHIENAFYGDDYV